MSARLRRVTGALAIVVLAATACGKTVLATHIEPTPSVEAAQPQTREEQGLSEGGLETVNLAEYGPQEQGAGAGGDPKCATNANPDHGFTADSMKWGTIIPLSGALRPLGEQTARVMKVSVQYLNSVTKTRNSFDWGCSTRPGIYGRTVELKVLSLTQNTQDEAAVAMRRLIDSEKVFLVRDCYLQSNLMGSATQYQNAQGVPGIWCYFSEMPYPALDHWNFSPGIDPLKIAAIHTGYLVHTQGRQRLAVLADPSLEHNNVEVVKRVYRHLVGRDIPSRCVVFKKSQEAQGGMQSEIQRIRDCYSGEGLGGPSPNAVIALDALNGTFGAISAQNQGWGMQDSDVLWSCQTCWVQTLADLCRDACKTMVTDCQALPCIPWSDLPAADELEEVRSQYLPGEPKDILTYGPLAITLGLGIWLGMTGPDLSRENLRDTLENLKDWDAGIGPILNTGPDDHFGGKAAWLIQFTDGSFDDLTGGFLTLADVGVPESLTRLK